MREQSKEFDYDRYRRLLAEAVDEKRRMALINLLIVERAKDRAAVTATRIAEILGASRP
jgi:hypothetical protein